MLPLTPANNWTATILFFAGSNIKSNGLETPGFNIPQYAASKSCGWNRAATGTAGYGNTTYTVGQYYSYADNALLPSAIYNGSAPLGSRWSRDGLSASTIPRMCYSKAIEDTNLAVSRSGGSE
ncbi:copper radical oxidase [Athelia psychrophila]|uniref:Copper radical oxidase n=1 Tax=Athelia psychrophila TaxID=1759441 RepID=A0A166IIY2_9AGAM|nr:copper radical oxidase [Fibularhizoctonia sp. CBS 109695]